MRTMIMRACCGCVWLARGMAGSGRWVALEGAMEARAAQARSLALQRCVQGAGAWAGRSAGHLVSHRDADSDGPATWHSENRPRVVVVVRCRLWVRARLLSRISGRPGGHVTARAPVRRHAPPRAAARRRAPATLSTALHRALVAIQPRARHPSSPAPAAPGLRCASCAQMRAGGQALQRGRDKAGAGRRAPPHCRRAPAALPRRAHRPARPIPVA